MVLWGSEPEPLSIMINTDFFYKEGQSKERFFIMRVGGGGGGGLSL